MHTYEIILLARVDGEIRNIPITIALEDPAATPNDAAARLGVVLSKLASDEPENPDIVVATRYVPREDRVDPKRQAEIEASRAKVRAILKGGK